MAEPTHDDLVKDLAKHLDNGRRMVWTNTPLGPVWGNKLPAFADVLTLEKSWVHPVLRVYEIKVSRSDFHRGIQKGQDEKYLPLCHQLYFACPRGMVKLDEVPKECGLTVRGDRSWRVLRTAPMNRHTPGFEVMMALLLKGHQEHQDRWRQREREDLLHFEDFRKLSRDFGLQVAKRVSAAEDMVKGADKTRKVIAEALGQEFDTVQDALYALRNDVRKLLRQRRYAAPIARLTDILNGLFQGTFFFAENVPDRLREVAAQVELESEQGEEEERL